MKKNVIFLLMLLCLTKILNADSDRVLMTADKTFLRDVEDKIWFFEGFGREFSNEDVIKPTLFENLPRIKQLLAYANYKFFLDQEGEVWKFGYQNSPQKMSSTTPGFAEIEKIIGGNKGTNTVFFLDKRGRVWVVGGNQDFYYLGLGDVVTVKIPTLIPNLPPIKEVITENGKTFFIDEKGQVWAFGSNHHNLLGLGHYQPVKIPTLIATLGSIIKVIPGTSSTLFIDTKGEIWAVGTDFSIFANLHANFPTKLSSIFNSMQSTQKIRNYRLILRNDTSLLMINPLGEHSVIEGSFKSITKIYDGFNRVASALLIKDDGHVLFFIEGAVKDLVVEQHNGMSEPLFIAVATYGYSTLLLDTESRLWKVEVDYITESARATMIPLSEELNLVSPKVLTKSARN